MHFSFLKEIMTSAWHIDAITFQQYAPIVYNTLKGLRFQEEDEPQENVPFLIGLETGNMTVMEAVKNGRSSENYVNVVPIRGPMLKHDTVSGQAGMRTVAQRISEGDKNPQVQGTVLIFETGGGSADAVPELSDAISRSEKPVVSWVDGLMASAGMYAGAYTDEIMASRPDDRVGSIGTMIMMQGREQVSKDSDNNLYLRIYADDATQKNEEFEKALNEQNFELVKERILNPHNDEFIKDMREQRPNVESEQLHGRVYSAKDVQGTLIDSIGSFNDAINRVSELAEDNQESQTTQTTMQEYTNVNKVLGVESLEFQDGYTSLSEDQVEDLENTLEDLRNAKGELESANNTISEKDQEIENLQTQIQELKNGKGAEHSEVYKETDGGKEGNYDDEMLSKEDKELFNLVKQ